MNIKKHKNTIIIISISIIILSALYLMGYLDGILDMGILSRSTVMPDIEGIGATGGAPPCCN